MVTPTAKQAETEQQIRERLEETGEFGKMRAMIVEAALQSLARDQSAEAKAKLFYPSAALTEAKNSAHGRQALGAVYAYLAQLGLQYSASVLALETGLPAEELAAGSSSGNNNTAAGLLAVIGAPSTSGSLPAAPALASAPAPAAVSVPVPVVTGAKSPTTASSSAASSVAESESHSVDGKNNAEGSSDKDAAEMPPQPGAEDSTYYISKWKKKTFVRVDQVAGQQVQVEYLTDCTVIVLDPLDSMTVDDCEGGQLVVAACEGSVFLRNCKNMTVHVVCKQLRTRDCENVDLHIFTTTDPVVEMSHHMTLRPFHLRLPNLRRNFKEARLDPACNRFVHVYDFTVDEPSLPKPHFTVKYPDPSVTMENRCSEHGEPECPPEIEDLLTGKLLPAASSESGQNKSYDIKSGSAAWAAAAATTTDDPASPDDGKKDSDADEDGEEEEGEEEEEVEESVDEDGGDEPAAIPVPSFGSRPPVAPDPPQPAAGAAGRGGLDSEEYSSFEDSSDSADKDDQYEVEEDDDDF